MAPLPPAPLCRAGLDLAGTEATLRQLLAWQGELESMPMAATAGLLRVDAAQLRAGLLPVVASARERISGLLLELASDSCRGLLHELTVWLEVAAARPPELDGFLPWAAGLADMRQGSAAQLGAAAAADAALELVVAFAGRLPTAEAVKRDDLREAAGKLEAELAAAAAWEAEQRAVHAGAGAEQARQLAEEAVMLESELKVGQGRAARACWWLPGGLWSQPEGHAAATVLLMHLADNSWCPSVSCYRRLGCLRMPAAPAARCWGSLSWRSPAWHSWRHRRKRSGSSRGSWEGRWQPFGRSGMQAQPCR